MHLTNYSVNKHNENFERDETADKGSKRSIGWFTEFLRANHHDVAKFWGDVSVRTHARALLHTNVDTRAQIVDANTYAETYADTFAHTRTRAQPQRQTDT